MRAKLTRIAQPQANFTQGLGNRWVSGGVPKHKCVVPPSDTGSSHRGDSKQKPDHVSTTTAQNNAAGSYDSFIFFFMSKYSVTNDINIAIRAKKYTHASADKYICKANFTCSHTVKVAPNKET